MSESPKRDARNGRIPTQEKLFMSDHGMLWRDKYAIVDIDGVLWNGAGAADGACEALSALCCTAKGVCLLTNDALSSRESRRRELAEAGFDVSKSRIFTASYLVAEYIRMREIHTAFALGAGEGLDELRDIRLTADHPAAVVVIDVFDYYSRGALQTAYSAIINGAELIAAQRNRSWSCDGEQQIDIGFWVSGLEYCTGKRAVVVGKPARFSYEACMKHLGASPAETVMISDDLSSDLRGAREIGLATAHIDPSYEFDMGDPGAGVTICAPSLARLVSGK
jgi:HAD superfamily hydrolase (TIGR01450 family)